jgi:transcriptional regulator with XRE-family HTH domain
MSANILHFVAMDSAPNRIRELRMAAKLSQQRLADAVGVSKVTISDLERGAMQLTHDYMKRLAYVLSVEAADLLPVRDNAWALDADERALIARYRMASDEQRDQVQRLADVIIPYRATDRDAA